MSKKFPEYKGLNLSKINEEVLKKWDENDTFDRSLQLREGHKEFIFYEGPPSANGMPGIHHVMARSIKDAICRYKTLQGYRVDRKAGWDTHGLPVELGVEKALGITKEDIGKTISVEEYNAECRRDVMKYTDAWVDLTRRMGYWVDMHNPYITYDNRYIETLWWLLKQLYSKGFLYEGYTIQPYSPAAGTGLSSHELNLPGCYRDVKDTTCVALFRVKNNKKSAFLFDGIDTPGVSIMAWTTTPWTLPSNTALAVGAEIKYVRVRTFNPYTSEPVTVVLAQELVPQFFPQANEGLSLDEYKPGDKKIPFKVSGSWTGKQLKDIDYEQLIDWVNPGEGAFRVIVGDFVTTTDGTGIVHIAPTFGADDYRAGLQNNIPPMLVKMSDGFNGPLVDKKGRMVPVEDMDQAFVKTNVNLDTYGTYAGRFVKNDYDPSLTAEDSTLDVDIAVMLKQEGKVFRIEKHVHNYPHCWRTDKPVLYYPLDSWFIRTTAVRDRMIELNNTIKWKPESTGTGRFGKWLENLVDWNLSRSRYWGTPLPIWMTEDRKEEICIGSVTELKSEIEKSVAAGFMKTNPLAKFTEGDNSAENYSLFDLHRPFVDDIILVSASGKPMKRESDLIDVWFDSGAMPYAQVHYPFENKEEFDRVFPADFIAEGVDQTRGWFFTLHAIATMISDSVSFRNIISNGLVLDKNGNKMSKRLGNAVDPFSAIGEHGSDPLRWYMLTNAQPWDNLRFDISGVDEVKRKFFGTLYNTYSFFALYANVDGFAGNEPQVPVEKRPEIDRWIISLLNTLVKEVTERLDDYDITPAGRAISEFVTENLSNWYVRLNRKRYWGGGLDEDKLAAYQTLFTCLETISILSAPMIPFFADRIYTDLNAVRGDGRDTSVHLVHFPSWDKDLIDKDLEERMEIAQKVSSMILALRRKVNIRVRQPLARIMVPVTDSSFRAKFEAVRDLVLAEVNVREVEYIDDTSGLLIRKVKPNFKLLGPRFGKAMKDAGAAIQAMSQKDIEQFEKAGEYQLVIDGNTYKITTEDVEIISEDIPGWLVANEGRLTVALDITVTPELLHEGIAREFVNRIQNIRKESGYEVTDKIDVQIEDLEFVHEAVRKHSDYIASQTLAGSIVLTASLSGADVKEIDIEEQMVKVVIRKR
ncbi:MAG TPA: isoleucine--tRNA ligase [Bacteroidales bacterium]|nr:isoleucine--tRNA ligase [Bacteroidales bacterium]